VAQFCGRPDDGAFLVSSTVSTVHTELRIERDEGTSITVNNLEIARKFVLL
jgi:hypothetical protein